MLARRGFGRLLQAYRTAAEPCCAQQAPLACIVLDTKAHLHCLAAGSADQAPSSSSGRQSGRDQWSGHFRSLPWSLPHQARLASTTPAVTPDEELLEGSEPASDVQPAAGADSFSPEATAQASAPTSSAADSSLDASSVLDAVGMAEADSLASALEGVWPLTAGMQSVLLGIHSVTGLPW